MKSFFLIGPVAAPVAAPVAVPVDAITPLSSSPSSSSPDVVAVAAFGAELPIYINKYFLFACFVYTRSAL